MKLWWLAIIPACVASVDGWYEAGDDLDDEDTAQHAQAGGPVSFQVAADGSYVDWKNDQGRFRIYQTCLGPRPDMPGYLGKDGSVGPGYIATVWNKNGKLVVDDTSVLAYLGMNSGATGLGMFGFHMVRKPQNARVPFGAADVDPTTLEALKNPDGSLVGDHTAQITGKWCQRNRRPTDYGGYRGWGVRSWSSSTSGYYVAPSISGNVGQFAIEATLGDDTADLVLVRYTYRISSDAVKVWVRVINLCSDGACDLAHGTVFVKEPKISAGINPQDVDGVGSKQMNIFNDTGHTATTIDRRNYWTNECSGVPADNKLCEWGGRNPRHEGGGGTGQCNDPTRRRVRFWNPQLACAADPSCLVVAARSADTELGQSYPWQSAHGLDLWAQRNVSEGREQAGTIDTKADGYLETDNCHQNSGAIANRRWEMAGYAKSSPGCSYTEAVASFHGWEGGTGTYDCEPLYYKLGHSPATARESYVVALSYGFGAAPLP